ncbi:MAG: type VI secretion system baseplate subunit TssG [Phycisphaerae bacterium]|nr:type VI secretion system baseplate subunit TssG [Phycisphaerae bacterium]
MAGDGGPPSHDLTPRDARAVVEALAAAPHAYDFFEAMRRIECAFSDHPRLGRGLKAADSPVRLGQAASLAFAPTTLAGTGTAPDARLRLLVHFFGLLGPNGPMPLHVTEYARDRELNASDPTPARFFDLFNHRAIELFYRAWAAAQPVASHQRPDNDRFTDYIASLIGLGLPAMRDRSTVQDRAKLYFSGRLVAHTRNAEGLVAIVAEYFALPATIDDCVGRWLDLDESRRLRLGESPATGALGRTAIVGARVWDRQQHFRITLGPLDYPAYERFLPGGRSLTRLVDWVRQYIGDELSWDVRLVLRQDSVPSVQLGKLGRLGWSTWSTSKPYPKDADHLVLRPVPA